jgi:hypothetical protein
MGWAWIILLSLGKGLHQLCQVRWLTGLVIVQHVEKGVVI